MTSVLKRVVTTSALVGHTAVASFGYTKLGYRVRGIAGDPVEADLSGQTIVVTGATSGLGKAAAQALAGLGARIIVVSRTPEKVEATVAELGAQARGEVADLSLLEQTWALGDRLLRDEPRIDVLINNAGLLLPERSTTAEGLETSVATNVVSHFLLTNMLIPRLVDSAPARIINVSSGGMYTQPLDVDKMLECGRDVERRGCVRPGQTSPGGPDRDVGETAPGHRRRRARNASRVGRHSRRRIRNSRIPEDHRGHPADRSARRRYHRLARRSPRTCGVER